MQNPYPKSLIVAAICAGLASCASGPAPREDMAVASKAVERAAATPETVALAPVEVERARAKYEAAQRAMANRDYDAARRLADEAEADARAAEARAMLVKNDRALKEVQGALNGLREELARRRG